MMAASTAAVDWLARAIALAGLALALASLIWQVIAWLRTGAQVTVEIEKLLALGHDSMHQTVAVSAVNKGRTPITVRQVGTRLPDGTVFWPSEIDEFKDEFKLPFRLEPGTYGSWLFPLSSFDDVPGRYGAKARVRGYVWLGTGKRMVSRKGVVVSALLPESDE